MLKVAKRERGERIQIMLSVQELAFIDDFRFKHRFPSRAAALVRYHHTANLWTR
jgi:hypothetical protein